MAKAKVSLVKGIGLIAETEIGFAIIIGGSEKATGSEKDKDRQITPL